MAITLTTADYVSAVRDAGWFNDDLLDDEGEPVGVLKILIAGLEKTVYDYASNAAPESLLNLAAYRLARFWSAESTDTTNRQPKMDMAAAFRRSGAQWLLRNYTIRRAGRIG